MRYRLRRATAEEVRKGIEVQLNYVVNHSDMLRYATFRAAGLAVGSGIQETMCKSLVAQRMKRSGMSWRTPGGQAILTSRAWQRTGRTDDAWDLLRQMFRRDSKVVAWRAEAAEQRFTA